MQFGRTEVGMLRFNCSEVEWVVIRSDPGKGNYEALSFLTHGFTLNSRTIEVVRRMIAEFTY